MKRLYKKADGLSVVIIVVISVLLVMAIAKPSFDKLLNDYATPSQTLGQSVENTALAAINKG